MQKLQLLEKLIYDPGNKEILVPKHTDKIVLPEKILNALVSLQKQHDIPHLPHPLVFRLSTPSHNTYVGVKEFHDLNDENIFLSEDVCKRLNIDLEEDHLEPKKIQLSLELALNVSGTDGAVEKAVLEIVPRENYRIHDWKTFLESMLPINYTAVSTNDILTFEVNNKEYIVQVSSVKTTKLIRTVCVIDCDIELQVKLPESVFEDDEKNREKGSEVGEYTDLFGDRIGFIDINCRIKLKLSGNEKFKSDGEFALAFDQFVDRDRFEFGTMFTPKKEWINETDDEVTVFVYSLGKEEADGKIEGINFSIIAEGDDEDDQNDGVGEEIDIEDDSIRCKYCHNIIKKSAMVLHENFCMRNNILCPGGCGEVFLKKVPENHWHCCSTFGFGEWSKSLHIEFMHASVDGITFNCSLCNEYQSLTKYTLCEHVSRECTNALHECIYCHLIIPRGGSSDEAKFYGVSQHEWLCGSKTTECSKCNKIIKLRDLETHMRLHDIARISRSTPRVCSNDLCVKVLSIEDSNPVGLCPDCFGNLYSTVYDPDGKRLLQRIERRYILQLKNGCGYSTCENKLCRSSPMCCVGEGILSNMAEIVKYVKNKVMLVGPYEFMFCVPKSVDERRHIVNMFEGGEWERGWVCKSNEVQGNDMVSMLDWLNNNAVKKSEACK